MNLAKMLKKENIFIGDTYEDTDNFYADYSDFLKQRGIVNNKEDVKRLFIKRENIHSTAIGKGAAAPHIFSDKFSQFVFSLALIKNGLDFKAPDNGNVYLVFLIMSNERDVGMHLKSLAHIGRLVRCTDIVEDIRKAGNVDDVHNIFLEKEKAI